MATFRLLNPDAAQLEAAIANAVRQANHRARARKVFEPPGLARQILGTAEGSFQDDGGGGPPASKYQEYDNKVQTSSLYAAWWTSAAGEKFVLIDGRRVEARTCTPDSPQGVARLRVTPEAAIRGWRKPKTRSLRIDYAFDPPFHDLGRLPEFDPVREALRLSALYGDTSAGAALHDYDQEHGVKAR
jgi:hypothetical protein